LSFSFVVVEIAAKLIDGLTCGCRGQAFLAIGLTAAQFEGYHILEELYYVAASLYHSLVSAKRTPLSLPLTATTLEDLSLTKTFTPHRLFPSAIPLTLLTVRSARGVGDDGVRPPIGDGFRESVIGAIGLMEGIGGQKGEELKVLIEVADGLHFAKRKLLPSNRFLTFI
jgi:hypothetical protein